MKPFRIAIAFLFIYPMLAVSQEPPSTEGSQAKLVVIGASYAENWPINQAGCLDILNRGVNGQVSTEVRDRFEQDALSVRPKAVLIWGFINDFSNNLREVEDETRETAIRNIEAMAEAAAKAGVIPVLATEVTMGAPDSLLDKLMGWIGSIRGKRSFQQYISNNVMTANEWIRGYANQKGYPLLDIEKLMTNDEGNRKTGYFTPDLSHITDKAYQDLNAYVIPLLEKELIKPYHLCSDD